MIYCRLKELMEVKNITQTEIIDATGITRPTLIQLMNNDSNGIKFSTIEKLCDFLNVSMNELIARESNLEKFHKRRLFIEQLGTTTKLLKREFVRANLTDKDLIYLALEVEREF